MFNALARFAVKFRWPIIIFWIVLVPVANSTLPSINSVSQNNNSDFLPKNSQSEKAVNLEEAFQPKNTANAATIVIYRADGPLTTADDAAIAKLVAAEGRVSGVAKIKDAGSSHDGQAHIYNVLVGSKGNGPQGQAVVTDLRDNFKTANLPSGLEVHLTGLLAQDADSQKSNNKGKDNTTLYTIIFILLLLLLVFRSVLAPIVTLIPAALALAIAQPIIAKSTAWGVQVSFITEILLIVMMLGAGTDYGLFLVFRVREELRNGLDTKEAVVRALGRVGETITFSAATVAAALLSLLLASFGLYKGLGPALAIGLVIMLLVALTFLPALLAVLGRAAFWPSKTVKQKLRIGLWGKVADRVIKRPLVMICLGLLLFGGLALGIIGYKASGFNSGNSPSGSDSAKGDAILSAHFSSAESSPQLVIMRFNSSVLSNLSNLQKVQKAEQLLSQSKDFKTVNGPFQANGFIFTPQQVLALHGSKSQLAVIESQFISGDGKTVQFLVQAAAGPAGSTALSNATPQLQASIQNVGQQVGADQTAYYSADAIVYDINHIATSDLKKIIPVVLVVIGILLAILLRSLVAPWYLIASVGLSYLASLGFAMLIFVHWLGQDGLNFVVAFMLFVFCMALGEDYNILVMSRIREESHHHASLRQAVTKAIGVTGTTVTSAGLILAGTFGVLGLVGGNVQIEQIGYSIAFGILLDTFLMRTLLVPSIVTIIGRWNWWPSKLSQTQTKD